MLLLKRPSSRAAPTNAADLRSPVTQLPLACADGAVRNPSRAGNPSDPAVADRVGFSSSPKSPPALVQMRADDLELLRDEFDRRVCFLNVDHRFDRSRFPQLGDPGRPFADRFIVSRAQGAALRELVDAGLDRAERRRATVAVQIDREDRWRAA